MRKATGLDWAGDSIEIENRFRPRHGESTYAQMLEHFKDYTDTIGDFVIWTKRAQPSYQLAVIIDDARQGVTHIIRGNDLLDSASRQLLLYRALKLSPEPTYTHLPLIRGRDGKRLAKRHGDSRLSHYRHLGVTPKRIIGLLAEWCGLGPRREQTAAEFLAAFDLAKLPRPPITFTTHDDAWLRA